MKTQIIKTYYRDNSNPFPGRLTGIKKAEVKPTKRRFVSIDKVIIGTFDRTYDWREAPLREPKWAALSNPLRAAAERLRRHHPELLEAFYAEAKNPHLSDRRYPATPGLEALIRELKSRS